MRTAIGISALVVLLAWPSSPSAPPPPAAAAPVVADAGGPAPAAAASTPVLAPVRAVPASGTDATPLPVLPLSRPVDTRFPEEMSQSPGLLLSRRIEARYGVGPDAIAAQTRDISAIIGREVALYGNRVDDEQLLLDAMLRLEIPAMADSVTSIRCARAACEIVLTGSLDEHIEVYQARTAEEYRDTFYRTVMQLGDVLSVASSPHPDLPGHWVMQVRRAPLAYHFP